LSFDHEWQRAAPPYAGRHRKAFLRSKSRRQRGYLLRAGTDGPTPDQVTADQVTADQVTADQVTADQVTADQVTADHVVAGGDHHGLPAVCDDSRPR